MTDNLAHVDPLRLGEYRAYRDASRDAANLAYLLNRVGSFELALSARDAQAVLKAHAQTLRTRLPEGAA